MSSGVKLPLKWMAIESIEDGIFTEKTDIVREISICITILTHTHTHSGHLVLQYGKCLMEGRHLMVGFHQHVLRL